MTKGSLVQAGVHSCDEPRVSPPPQKQNKTLPAPPRLVSLRPPSPLSCPDPPRFSSSLHCSQTMEVPEPPIQCLRGPNNPKTISAFSLFMI